MTSPLPDVPDSDLARLATWQQQLRERERAALAKRLHDLMGGLLTAARMDLSWIKGRLHAETDEALQTKIAAIDSGLSEAMNLKRALVDELRPALLDHFGLATALQAHCEDRCRRAQMPVDIVIPEDLPELLPDLSLAVFRVVELGLERMLEARQLQHVELVVEQEEGVLGLALTGSGAAPTAYTLEQQLAFAAQQHWLSRYGATVTLGELAEGGLRLLTRVPLHSSLVSNP